MYLIGTQKWVTEVRGKGMLKRRGMLKRGWMKGRGM